MATGENTVASQGRYYHDKKAFIHTQVRLLEAPIQPPSDWKRHSQHRTAQEGTRDPVPDNVVSAALSKLHATSRKASRLTFNNQSIRQLLEQLEANQYELRRKARRGGIIIRTKPVQEILETDWIDMFPETWRQEDGRSSATGADPSSSSSAARTPATKQQKYADLRSRIVTLQKKYQSLKDRHEHYKALQLEVRRLHTGEIQQNILSPDSQVIQELEKMKVQRKHFRMNGDLYVVAVGLSMETHSHDGFSSSWITAVPQLLAVLQSKRGVLSAKRKHQETALGQDIGATKRQRQQPTNPLDAVMELL